MTAFPNSNGASHEGRTPNDYRVRNDGLLVYQTPFAGDGIIKNPADILLTQIFFALDVAAQVARAHTGAEFPQRTDPVQPGIPGMGNLADFVFLTQRVSSFRCLVLVRRSRWASLLAA